MFASVNLTTHEDLGNVVDAKTYRLSGQLVAYVVVESDGTLFTMIVAPFSELETSNTFHAEEWHDFVTLKQQGILSEIAEPTLASPEQVMQVIHIYSNSCLIAGA